MNSKKVLSYSSTVLLFIIISALEVNCAGTLKSSDPSVTFQFVSIGGYKCWETLKNGRCRHYDRKGIFSKFIIAADNLVPVLPKDTNINTVEILPNYQVLQVLRKKSLKGLHLEQLTVTFCELREIEPGTLQEAAIDNYKFDNNSFEKLTTGMFSNHSFGNININSNNISLIEPGTFQGATIDYLSLSNNSLEEIKAEYFENSSIREIVLDNNNISEIQPGSFQNIANLTRIYLYRNNIENITDVFNDLPNIQRIDLSENYIKTLEAGTFSNSFLDKTDGCLTLKENEITEIKKGVFNNSSITQIDLYKNRVTDIEEGAFDNLPYLKHLYLHKNELESIKTGIFSDFINVTHLFLANNKISSIEPDSFRNSVIEVLDLDYNNLTAIRKHVFRNMTFKTLRLKYNEIEYVEPGAFEGVTQLGEIDLSWNRLTEIKYESFNVPISGLYVHNNNISKIEPGALQTVKHSELRISDNPINISKLNISFAEE